MAPSIDATASFLCWEDGIAFQDDVEEEEQEEEEEEGLYSAQQSGVIEHISVAEEEEERGDVGAAISSLLEKEKSHMPRQDYWWRYQNSSLDTRPRQKAVAWLLWAHSYFNFRPLTAILSVNYLDRFLSFHQMPDGKSWMYQLLAVACLSLAAKTEETQVPLLLDLQMDGSEFTFEPKTIQRMELMVLSMLGWRMSSVTPLSYVDRFIPRMAAVCEHTRVQILLRVEEILVCCLQEMRFLQYTPAVMAGAAIVVAVEEINPNPAQVEDLKSYLTAVILSEESMAICVELMEELFLMKNNNKGKVRGRQEVYMGEMGNSPDRVLEASFSCYDSESGQMVGSLESSIITSSPLTKRRRVNHD